MLKGLEEVVCVKCKNDFSLVPCYECNTDFVGLEDDLSPLFSDLFDVSPTHTWQHIGE